MDFDDLLPTKKTISGAVIGENLESLSVGELEARVQSLQSEIARVEAELKKKRAHEAAANALFKS